MREILFRGKRIDNGEWVEGSFLVDGEAHRPLNKEHIPFSNCYIVHETDLENINTVFNDGSYCLQIIGYHVVPESVGQYTGLTDKSGKKIFEGDIIKSDNGNQSAVSVVCYGEFSPLMFYDLLENFVMPRPKEKLVGLFLRSTKNGEEMFLSNCSKLIEVIGNIHDNPDLLDEK